MIQTKMGRGKEAERIVKKMLQEAGFEVFEYGYEYTVPELANRRIKVKGESADYLRHMPDFVIVNKKNEALFIEVKFRYKSEIDLKHIFNYPNCYVILVTKQGFLGQSTNYLYNRKKDFTYLVNLPPFKYIDRELLTRYGKMVKRKLGDENLIGQLVENTAQLLTGKEFKKEPLKQRGKSIVKKKPIKPVKKTYTKKYYYYRKKK